MIMKSGFRLRRNVVIGNLLLPLALIFVPGLFVPGSYRAVGGNINLPTVTIGSVKRGGGLPFSVPPGKTCNVEVKIDPPADTAVTFQIKGGQGTNGTASLNPTSLSGNGGTLTVTGGNQTGAGVGPQLTIQAKYKGNVCGTSAAFAVCAHPKGVKMTYTGPIAGQGYGGANWWGSHFAVLFDKTEGSLDQIKSKENLTASGTGYFQGVPPPESLTGLDTILKIEGVGDYHYLGGPSASAIQHDIDSHGTDGSQVVTQYFSFTCGRCRLAQPKPVDASGFQITLTVSKNNGHYYINVNKIGSANNGTTNGTVDGSGSNQDEIK
jgi:hypothetical protein